MTKFSRARKEFIEGAEERVTPNQAQKEPIPGPKWAHLDPKSKPSKSISLRLNEWQLARLSAVAESQHRSKQSVIQHALELFVSKALEQD